MTNAQTATQVANNIYLPNKYTQWYYSIINNALNRHTTPGITETHHIVMESFYINRTRKGKAGWLPGDPNDPSNLVKLTPKEHYVCHMLLVRMTVGKAKVKAVFAARYLCLTKKDQLPVNSRLYASLKEMYNNIDKKGHPAWNKGKSLSAETCQRMSESAKRRFEDPEQRRNQAHMKGRRHSEETKALMSQQRNGKKLSEDHKRKIGLTNQIRSKDRPAMKESTRAKLSLISRSRIWTDELRAKAKAAMKGKKIGYKWWTDGVTSKCAPSCPGEGWTAGRHKSP